MKPGDVVISVTNNRQHVVLYGKRPGFLVSSQCVRKVVHTDEASCFIMQSDGNRFRIFLLVPQKILVRALVTTQRFVEAILAIQYVSRVEFNPRQPPLVAFRSKDLPGFFRRGCRLFVFPQQDMRLNRRVEGTG